MKQTACPWHQKSVLEESVRNYRRLWPHCVFRGNKVIFRDGVITYKINRRTLADADSLRDDCLIGCIKSVAVQTPSFSSCWKCFSCICLLRSWHIKLYVVQTTADWTAASSLEARVHRSDVFADAECWTPVSCSNTDGDLIREAE